MSPIFFLPKSLPSQYSAYHLDISNTFEGRRYLELYHKIRTPFDTHVIGEEGWDERLIHIELNLTIRLPTYERHTLLQSLYTLTEQAIRHPERIPGTIHFTEVRPSTSTPYPIIVNQGKLSIHMSTPKTDDLTTDLCSLITFAENNLPHRIGRR